jgi:xanthine dehydrogenase molybdenum-binding subunit
VDGREKVTGALIYGSDFTLPGALVGKILRSPFAHARIVSIDTTAAKALAGVHAVITAADTPEIPFGFQSIINSRLADKLPLQADRVRFIGDEVAAVAAEDEATALEAISLIDVVYEEMPAVFDPERARSGDAPIIHDAAPNNVIDTFDYGEGDVDLAMSQADVTVEGTFYSTPVAPAPMETHQALASWDSRGRLTMYASIQMPFLLRNHLAGTLGIDEGRVRILKMPMGGGFGSRMEMHPLDPIAAVLAKVAKRPVRIIYSRRDEFLATRFRHPMTITARVGAKFDGTITALDMNLLTDSGAYVAQALGVARVGAVNAMTLYRVPNTRVHSEIVYTNNPYASAYRGYGNPQTTFALESLITELAEKLALDEIDLRIRNGNTPHSRTYLGQEIDSCGYEECLVRGREAAHWDELRGKRLRSGSKVRGVGVGTAINVGGGARDQGDSDSSGAVLIMQDDGSVTVNTGGQEIGTGGTTVFSQIVAEELGVGIDRVTIMNSDTDVMPWDIGAHAQRNLFVAGNAVRNACLEARKILLAEVERQFTIDQTSVMLRDDSVWVADSLEPIATIGQVARAAHFRSGGQLIWGKGFYDPPTVKTDQRGHGHKSGAYSFGAQFAEVEVDLATGHVAVTHLVGAHDVGFAINPAGAEGQIEGGMVQGLGQAISELLHMENGEILNPMMHAYGIPTAPDTPSITSILVESHDAEGPYGAKGIGEVTIVPTCAAIANAIFDATGVRIRDMPFTPERVLGALRAAGIDESSEEYSR